MATIEQLTKQLIDVNKDQVVVNEENVDAIDNLTKSVNKLLRFHEKAARMTGRQLEAEREGPRRGVRGAGAPATSSSSSSSGMSPIIPPMGSFAIPALIALGASLTGLDAVIRALALPKTFSLFGKTITTFKNTITGIGTTMSTFADSVKNFKIKLPDLPKIRFVDLAGEPYDFSKWTKKIPTVDVTAIRSNVVTFFDDIATKIKTFVTVDVTAIRSNVVTFFDDIATKINTDLVDKMDDFNVGMSSIKTRVNLFLGGIYLEFDKAWAGASDEFIKHMTNIKTRSLSFFTDIIAKLKLLLPGAGTEGFKTITDKITSIKTGVGGFFDSAKEMVTQKLTLPDAFTNRITAIKTGVGGFFDSTKTFVGDNLKFDMGSKITSIKTSVGTFFDNIPRIQFEMPAGADKIGEKLRSVIGTLSAGAGGAEAGTGILGFLNRVFTFMSPLLTPFKFVLRTVMRPLTQIFITLIDFVTGFYEGFTKSDEEGFLKKLKDGIEGGVIGVIKGFTDAINAVFVELPAWLLKKLGFTGVAEKLKEFNLTALVDPAWEAVKDFFTTTIPDKMEEWKKAYADFDPMEFITEKFEMVKCFFTDTIPNEIAKFNPLKDFDLIGSLTTSISGLLDSIVSIIPSGEAIKKMIINAAKLIPSGEKILKLAGLIPDPEAEARAALTDPMKLPAELTGGPMDGTVRTYRAVGAEGKQNLTLGQLEDRATDRKNKELAKKIALRNETLAKTMGISVEALAEARDGGPNPDLVRRLAKELNPVVGKREDEIVQERRHQENQANLRALREALMMRDAVREGSAYTTNNYVAASQGSTDTELSWVERFFLK